MKTIIFTLFAVFGVACSLDCFVCNSHQDVSCKDPFSANSTAMVDAFLETCPVVEGKDSFCRKTTMWFDVNGEIRVHRDCGTMRREEYGCYQKRAEDHVMNVCQCDDDLCNTANRVTTSSVLTAMVAALGALVLAKV